MLKALLYLFLVFNSHTSSRQTLPRDTGTPATGTEVTEDVATNLPPCFCGVERNPGQ